MKCPNSNCKSDNPPGAKFCNQCGAKLEVLKKCPYPDCGKEGLPVLAKYCPDCGRSLGASEPVPLAGPKKSYDTPSGKLVAMVKVEGGTFKMGSTNYSDEQPIHQVTLDTFYIGKFPVTQREWEAVMGSNPSYFKRSDRPMEAVSWYDAVKFCNALSKREGLEECYKIDGTNVVLDEHTIGYRLPTEAEWEYAACGGNKSRGYTYAGSNNLGEVGWYEDNSGKTTHSVQQKASNELGLYDMSGNVWEWCWDWYDGNYYAGSPNKNPTGPASGSYRVYRGGSWNNSAGNCSVSYRYYYLPGNSYFILGFRLALACSSK